MARIKKNPIEFKCNKCGSYQPPYEKSDDGLEYHKCNQKCDCGGEFVMWYDGIPMRPYREEKKEDDRI